MSTDKLENKPLITVIVPVYRIEKYVGECIESIMRQTYKNIEILLMVGRTEDNCEKICNSYAQKDSRIKVIVSEPKGLSDARNQGLEIARGEYIGFVDGDDWIEPDMYETLARILEENHADISVCGTYMDYREPAKPDEATDIAVKCVDSGEGIASILYQKEIVTSAWDKLYKRELFREIRYPLGRALEDLFTTYKLFDKADKIVMTYRKEYHYRVRMDSLLNSYSIKSQNDADDALVEVEAFVKEKYPELQPAVNSMYVRTNFSFLRHNIESEFNKEYAKKAVKNIRSRALGVVFDRRTTKMAKAVALVGSMGICVSRFFLRLFDHRASRAY